MVSVYFPVIRGFLSTTMTESPLRNILEMYLSLFTGLDFFFPFPLLGTSVHISFTFSKTMLQCLREKKIWESTWKTWPRLQKPLNPWNNQTALPWMYNTSPVHHITYWIHCFISACHNQVTDSLLPASGAILVKSNRYSDDMYTSNASYYCQVVVGRLSSLGKLVLTNTDKALTRLLLQPSRPPGATLPSGTSHQQHTLLCDHRHYDLYTLTYLPFIQFPLEYNQFCYVWCR